MHAWIGTDAAGSKRVIDTGDSGIVMESGFNLTLHTITFALYQDSLGMVEKAVKYCGGKGGVIVEDFRPLFERTVRGNDDGASFIAQADYLEEQVCAMLVNRQKAEFIQTE